MYGLLKNYVLYDNKEALTEQGKDILMNVIWLPGVKNTAVNSIVTEAQNTLENQDVYNLAVNSALSNLEK